MTKSVDHGRSAEGEDGEDSRGPFDSDKVDGLAVGDARLDTGKGLASLGRVDVHADAGVEIGDGVGDTGQVISSALGNGNGERDGNLAHSHGAETLEVGEVIAAGVDLCVDDVETVCVDIQIKGDLAVDGGGGLHVDVGAIVAGGVDDVELPGGEPRVLLAGVERLGDKHVLGRGHSSRRRQESDDGSWGDQSPGPHFGDF